MSILVTIRSTFNHRAALLLLMPAVACAGAPIASSQAPTAVTSSESAVLRDSLTAILSRAQRDSAFPGAYAVVGTHAGILAADSVGHLDWGPSAVPDEHSL